MSKNNDRKFQLKNKNSKANKKPKKSGEAKFVSPTVFLTLMGEDVFSQADLFGDHDGLSHLQSSISFCKANRKAILEAGPTDTKATKKAARIKIAANWDASSYYSSMKLDALTPTEAYKHIFDSGVMDLHVGVGPGSEIYSLSEYMTASAAQGFSSDYHQDIITKMKASALAKTFAGVKNFQHIVEKIELEGSVKQLLQELAREKDFNVRVAKFYALFKQKLDGGALDMSDFVMSLFQIFSTSISTKKSKLRDESRKFLEGLTVVNYSAQSHQILQKVLHSMDDPFINYTKRLGTSYPRTENLSKNGKDVKVILKKFMKTRKCVIALSDLPSTVKVRGAEKKKGYLTKILIKGLLKKGKEVWVLNKPGIIEPISLEVYVVERIVINNNSREELVRLSTTPEDENERFLSTNYNNLSYEKMFSWYDDAFHLLTTTDDDEQILYEALINQYSDRDITYKFDVRKKDEEESEDESFDDLFSDEENFSVSESAEAESEHSEPEFEPESEQARSEHSEPEPEPEARNSTEEEPQAEYAETSTLTEDSVTAVANSMNLP